MKKSKFSDSQILAILKEAEAGVPVLDLCRQHGMSNTTILSLALKIRWYGCLNDGQTQRA